MSEHDEEKTTGRSKKPIIIGVLLVALAGGYFFEEWSGNRAWEKKKAELTARGVNLNWSSIIPAPILDVDNFYATPVAQAWLPRRQDNDSAMAKKTRASAATLTPPPLDQQAPGMVPNWPLGMSQIPMAYPELQRLPASAPAGTLSREYLEKWINHWDSGFAQLREAGKRPKARLDGDYSRPFTIPIQDFVAFRVVAQILATRARLHLIVARPDLALLDLQTIDAQLKGLDTAPLTLVASMIRAAIVEMELEVVEDGFRVGVWKAPQLIVMQSRFANENVLLPVARSLREGEEAGVCELLERMADRRGDGIFQTARALNGGERNLARDTIISIMPRGWIRRNQVLVTELLENFIQTVDAKAQRVDFKKNHEAQLAAEAALRHQTPNNMIASIAIPNFARALVTSARIQSRAHLAAVACALERFKEAQGSYPESLDRLAPQFISVLPHDVVTGKHLLYRKSGSAFILYSAAKNGRDDGGKGSDTDDLDWVWAGK